MALKCSVEGCTFSTKPHSKYAKQELGRHMKFIHGVAGASSSAKTMQAKKEDVATEVIPNDASTTTTQAGKRSYNKAIKEDDAAILVYVGYIKASCEKEAEKLGISKEQFAKRVAELFYAYSLR